MANGWLLAVFRGSMGVAVVEVVIVELSLFDCCCAVNSNDFKKYAEGKV